MSFTSNVTITKSYPGVLYNASEASGVYHEDHEISGARYHVANATYNESNGTWSNKDTTQPAYATVQNTDGSTSYLYKPPTVGSWTTWQGAGQPVSYYAVNYGMTSTDSTGDVNTPALKAAIAAAIADPGNTAATVHLPAGSYNLNDTIKIMNQSGKGLVVKGASGGTTLVQTASTPVDMFEVNSWTGGPGVRFEDLYLSYPTTITSLSSPVYAVNLNTSGTARAENVTCERVYFDSCPGAFRTGPNALQCGLLNCTVDYENTNLANQVAVTLGGSQDFVRGCVIRQPIDNSPSGCTGILINAVMTCFITDTHVSDFQTGIQISDNAETVFFSNVRVEAWNTALAIAPSSSQSTIYDVHFSNCTLALESGSTARTSGITIGTGGGANSNVSSIFFDSCDVFGFANAGLEIDGGQDIVVTGGQYSSNGQNATASPYIGAGIAITGGNAITISGADCSGISNYWLKLNGTGSAQPYGITINELSSNNPTSDVTIIGCNVNGNATNGIVVANQPNLFPSNIYIRACDASGYSSYSAAIDVLSGESLVQATDCPGYNDRNQPLNGGAAPTSGTSASTCSTPYFGPSTVTFSNSSSLTVHVSGTPYAMSFGSIHLPRQLDQIYFSAAPSTFTWLGK